jgi:hypothetical protein
MREDRSATDETMETLSSAVSEDSVLNLERPLRYDFGGPDDATREYSSGTPVDVVITAIVGEEPRTHAALIGHLDAARAIISWFLATNDQASIRQAFVYLSSLRPAEDSPPDTAEGLAAEVGTFGVEVGACRECRTLDRFYRYAARSPRLGCSVRDPGSRARPIVVRVWQTRPTDAFRRRLPCICAVWHAARGACRLRKPSSWPVYPSSIEILFGAF